MTLLAEVDSKFQKNIGLLVIPIEYLLVPL